MSNCHEFMLSYEAEITPSLGELERSLTSRRLARRAITDYCVSLNIPVRFHPQGSFRLLTAVRRDGLDIDDGVLLPREHFGPQVSVDEVHELVFEALRRAGATVLAREPCIRVLYPRGIRVDIVTYLEDASGETSFGHRRDGWVRTHSSYLPNWFETAVDADAVSQQRRIVKYYKMWAARMAPCRMASGVAATILVKRLHRSHSRDDVALVGTLQAVLEHIVAGYGCVRPTPPVGEELLRDELDESQFSVLVDLLRTFVDVAHHAVACHDEGRAIELWQELLGPSFGAAGRQLTPQDRAWQLRRILEDFEGLSSRKVGDESAEGGRRWTF